VVLEVIYRPPETEVPAVRENLLLVAGPIALLLAVLVLGMYIPPPLQRVLTEAARGLGGVAP